MLCGRELHSRKPEVSGSKGLVHFRVALEKHFGKEALKPLAMIDVDFCNAFPSLEWGAKREAVEAGLSIAAPWAHWCHAAPTRIILPSGCELPIDRGAE